ncbi:MAG: polysaccharide biosynthesis tyrosine autokinase [Butyricicoccus sp.]
MENTTENNPIKQIDITSIVRDVLLQWWVILIWGVAVSLFAFVIANCTYQPQYTAKTTFVVTTKGMNGTIYQDMESANEIAGRFANVLESNILKRKVEEDLGVDKLEAETSVKQIEETNLLEVSVTAENSVKAFRILQSIMNNYDQVSDYIIEDVILEVIQPPTVPMTPANPLQKRRILLLSFLIGAAAAAAIIAAFSYFRDTVKNEEQMKEKIDAKYLGSVYHEKKSKSISMLITNPLRSFRFVESNRMTASRIGSSMNRHNATVLLVTSVVENEGKSTVAANIAIALAQAGNRVVLIDCDFRKPSQYKLFDLDKETFNGLTDAMSGACDAEHLIRYDHKTGLITVFSKEPYSMTEGISENQVLRGTILGCKSRADYVILDSAPMALVYDTEELAQLADASLLVVRRDTVLAKDINDAVDALNNTKGSVLGCVLNDADYGLERISSHYGYGYGGYYGSRADRTE